MKPQDAEIGKIYKIITTDQGLIYRVNVTYVGKRGIKGKYVPFANMPDLEVTGFWPSKKILTMEEI